MRHPLAVMSLTIAHSLGAEKIFPIPIGNPLGNEISDNIGEQERNEVEG